MKPNYQNEMLSILSELSTDAKPSLLLHSCCAPCSTIVIDILKEAFNLTVFYYNPNIEPQEEYNKRKSEQIRYINSLNIPNITMMDTFYDNKNFKELTKGLENEKEGGLRCKVCINHRLEKTATEAVKNGFMFFCTTLTVSPHKNSDFINRIGKELELKYGIKFLVSDFKKEGGYQKSVQIAKNNNLYRQNYCGCSFSIRRK